ncbi:UPF0182 family protein, partial [Dolichospermum sp. ST_sed2]|nr:UPF0182 family protein [Dolichospermum sp. ST_sed2]
KVVLASDYRQSYIGYQKLFTTPIYAKILLGLGSAVFVFIFLSLIFTFARKFSPTSKSFNVKFNTPQGPMMKLVDAGPIIRKITIPITILISIIIGITAATNWEVVLLFLNKVPFNSVDPLFGKDISYYIFTLPLVKLVVELIQSIVFIGIVGSLLIFFLLGVIQLRGGLRNLFKNTGPGIIRSAKRS